MELSFEELRDFLDDKVHQYNTPQFIELDPIQIPHRFSRKEDIEIAGFLTATISWGNRTMILRNANKMMRIMGDSPYDFLLNHKQEHLEKIDGFVHRTFNADDLKYFILALKSIYTQKNGLEEIFNQYQTTDSLQPAIHQLRNEFLTFPHQTRSGKHISDPFSGSACKKINMFLRWMVRKDNSGVDFGIWDKISPSLLSCPLDVHSGNTARQLGLLTRRQNDAKAVCELDAKLREMDKTDPVKYDFALFGLSVHEVF
ncbi:MAG: TIGR02757 family protein [Prolixibacteraceae bacterium]